MTILPTAADDEVAASLRRLTATLAVNHLLDADEYTAEGQWGGIPSDGAVYSNDVFALHPYCWCERDDCAYCAPCTCPHDAYVYLHNGQPTTRDAYRAAIRNSDDDDAPEWEAVPEPAKQCIACRTYLFTHKPSGSGVRWYKHLGRGMELDLHAPWEQIMVDCIASITATTNTTGTN